MLVLASRFQTRVAQALRLASGAPGLRGSAPALRLLAETPGGGCPPVCRVAASASSK